MFPESLALGGIQKISRSSAKSASFPFYQNKLHLFFLPRPQARVTYVDGRPFHGYWRIRQSLKSASAASTRGGFQARWVVEIFDRSVLPVQKLGGFTGWGQRSRAVWSPCFEYNNSMPLILIRNLIERYGKAREKKFKTSDCCGFPKLLKQPNNGITQN